MSVCLMTKNYPEYQCYFWILFSFLFKLQKKFNKYNINVKESELQQNKAFLPSVFNEISMLPQKVLICWL